MIFRKYVFIFLTGLICFGISMAKPSYVQASVVFEEIDKFVSPAEEMQIEKHVQFDLSEQKQTDIDEQPDVNEDEPDESEDSIQEPDDEQSAVKKEKPAENQAEIQNTKPVEEQTISAEETKPEPAQEDLSAENSQIGENIPVKSVSDEEAAVKKKLKKYYLLISKYFNQLCEWAFDKIIELKEMIIQYFPSNRFDCNMCCRPIIEHKQFTSPKKFIPYYFLYPESTKNYLERIAFTNNITHPQELLPYGYIMKNIEIRYDIPKETVTPQGITDMGVLLDAPSPKIEVMGKSMLAKLVIDIRKNTLYKYDEDGFPQKAYLVATGARGTRTKAGLRIVTYKEKFPYKGAPKDCKRLNDPYSYGPVIIFFNAVNPKTGRKIYVDQFLHGNGNEKSIGRKVSHGCVRTNNNVMRNELSKEVNRGDYVLLINPDVN